MPLIEDFLYRTDVADDFAVPMLFITKDVTHIQLDKIFLQQLSNHKPVPAQPGMFFDNEVAISICPAIAIISTDPVQVNVTWEYLSS